MTKKAFIEVELTLLTEEDGGRKLPLSLEDEKVFYRPHIVIGNVSQREAIRDPKTGWGIEEYLSVQFRPCQQTLHPGDTAHLILDLLFYPSIEYEKVKPQAEFTLREGSKIVGHGKVVDVHVTND